MDLTLVSTLRVQEREKSCGEKGLYLVCTGKQPGQVTSTDPERKDDTELSRRLLSAILFSAQLKLRPGGWIIVRTTSSKTVHFETVVLVVCFRPRCVPTVFVARAVRKAADGGAGVWLLEPPGQEDVRQQEAQQLGGRQLLAGEGAAVAGERHSSSGSCRAGGRESPAHVQQGSAGWLGLGVADPVTLLGMLQSVNENAFVDSGACIGEKLSSNTNSVKPR